MKDWIRRLSFQSEFTIVVLGAFGLALVSTLLALAAPDLVLHGAPPLTNARLLRTALFELVVGALLWQLLMLRAWTGAQLGLAPVSRSSRDFFTVPLIGIGLALAAYAAYVVLVIVAANISPDVIQQALSRHLVAAPIPITTVILVILINPVFEEVFVCGYVIASLRDRIGVTNAINVSAGIRVACHLYQGVTGVLSIIPFALIAAVWFARKGRLGPLILAHALVDFLGLLLA